MTTNDSGKADPVKVKAKFSLRGSRTRGTFTPSGGLMRMPSSTLVTAIIAFAGGLSVAAVPGEKGGWVLVGKPPVPRS